MGTAPAGLPPAGPGEVGMNKTGDPFRELIRLQERMNRLFEQALSRGDTPEEDLQRGAWSPPVDIEETPDRIVLRADLPGMQMEQIELKLQNDTLSIRGDRPFAANSRREDFLRIERPQGTFYRSFTLPRTVNQEGIQAELKNGVLEVTLPKKAETRPKQIRVEVG